MKNLWFPYHRKTRKSSLHYKGINHNLLRGKRLRATVWDRHYLQYENLQITKYIIYICTDLCESEIFTENYKIPYL